ncbi:UNVERIFIED_CONTAM: hypothetical protein K2H54_069727 [Gekko kuhli]
MPGEMDGRSLADLGGSFADPLPTDTGPVGPEPSDSELKSQRWPTGARDPSQSRPLLERKEAQGSKITMEMEAPGEKSGKTPTQTKTVWEQIWGALSYFTGDMKAFGDWMKDKPLVFQFLVWVLRGFSQVIFLSNPLSGLIIVAGLLVQSYWLALTGCLAAVVSTLTAFLLSQDRSAIAAGLHGYNGVIVGTLMAVFSDNGDYYWWLLLPVVLMSMTCPLLSSALGSVFSKWDLPVLTFPFNLALAIFVAATGHYNLFFPTTLILPITSVPSVNWSEIEVPLLFQSIPIGIAQGFGCDSPWTGGMIMVALFISSPLIFLHAVVGSVVGMLAALSLATPFDKIYAGLCNYNSCFSCIAIGGMFYAFTWQTFLLAIACALFTAYVGATLSNMLSVFGLPQGTWAFCLSTLTFLLLTTNNGAIHRLPLSKVRYPEANRAYYLSQKGKQSKSTCDV